MIDPGRWQVFSVNMAVGDIRFDPHGRSTAFRAKRRGQSWNALCPSCEYILIPIVPKPLRRFRGDVQMWQAKLLQRYVD